MKYWTKTEVRTLRELWPNHRPTDIGAIMGRSMKSVWAHAHRIGLTIATPRKRGQPPAEEWIRLATESAKEHGVHPDHVLSGKPSRRASWARWKAWQRILDSNPRYSIAGVGRVSGHCHSTIIKGLRQVGCR